MKRAFVCALAITMAALSPLGSAGALTAAEYPTFTSAPVDAGGVSIVLRQSPQTDGRWIVYQRRIPSIGTWGVRVRLRPESSVTCPPGWLQSS